MLGTNTEAEVREGVHGGRARARGARRDAELPLPRLPDRPATGPRQPPLPYPPTKKKHGPEFRLAIPNCFLLAKRFTFYISSGSFGENQ